ncbi:hypothetical protein N7510_002748 [Penicillium lagena]|uniref:uncharacterized protein n=1 Tax=Penicillium lagena TaxID=94218 RepID=UPI00253FE10A|nr:uncharacterized protein N7510_002748 [Penicillium lagena]KAJ5618764.1 hypothetical protein N7510_002748 [Penicillium lagena]
MSDNTVPLWWTIVQSKRASRDSTIPAEWRLQPGQVPDEQLNVIDVPVKRGILTSRELEITETDVTRLVQKLISREYSSFEVYHQAVTLAFCKHAAIAQQIVNCLSEILFEKALDATKRLHAEYTTTGITRGSLHGLPTSLKDCFKIEGIDATIEYRAYANQPTLQDETCNAIYGYTSNPYNRNLSSGGLSGGESAFWLYKDLPWVLAPMLEALSAYQPHSAVFILLSHLRDAFPHLAFEMARRAKKHDTGREMDALLMPCTAWPACGKYEFTYDNYSSLWNVGFGIWVNTPEGTTGQIILPQSTEGSFYQATLDGQAVTNGSNYTGRNDIEAKVWKN